MDHPSPGSLSEFVSGHEFFSAFDDATLGDLADELESVRLSSGQTLFAQGDPGDSMYLLVRGLLRIATRHPDGSETVVDVLDPGTSVGEMALFTGQPRTASVAAINDAELIRLSKAGFDRLSRAHPDALRAFAERIVPRWRRLQLLSALSTLYGTLDASALQSLESELEWTHLPSGARLFAQGDPGDAMYIVVNGRLRVVIEDERGPGRTITEVGRGETVGEWAMLTGEPRSASVYAMRDSDVVKLSQATFDRLHDRYPQMMRELTRMIIGRQQRALRDPGSHGARAATFVVAPIDPSADLRPFTRRLTEALGATGRTLHLSGDSFDRMYGRDGAAQTSADDPTDVAIVGWLTEQEARYRYLVYETDSHWSEWTERCLRQADRVLLVAHAQTESAPGAIERELARRQMPVRAELVLLQPGDVARPGGTIPWLQQRSVAVHHHVRLDNDLDLRRLARRISGQATGLVFSGGGARGFAHIGVIRALEEAGIEVDMVGGTSIGSLIGAAYAAGRSAAQMTELAQTFASPKQLMDRTLPLTSLMASAKVTALLQQLFGDARIEDLWQPFFCVSSDLTRAEPVIHDHGLLWEAVRASISIPGIFSPVLHNGNVLVDGAVMNHFPIDIMRGRCQGGQVIAVNASPRTEKLRNYQFGHSISGWQVLRSRVNPFAARMRVPSILHTLMRATEISSIYHLPGIEHMADVMIQPAVEQYRTLDFGAYEPIIAAGYDAAQPVVASLRQAQTAAIGTAGDRHAG